MKDEYVIALHMTVENVRTRESVRVFRVRTAYNIVGVRNAIEDIKKDPRILELLEGETLDTENITIYRMDSGCTDGYSSPRDFWSIEGVEREIKKIGFLGYNRHMLAVLGYLLCSGIVLLLIIGISEVIPVLFRLLGDGLYWCLNGLGNWRILIVGGLLMFAITWWGLIPMEHPWSLPEKGAPPATCWQCNSMYLFDDDGLCGNCGVPLKR